MKKKHIGLLNCGSTKHPRGPIKARDLYRGIYFETMLSYMKNIICPDEIFIISTRINRFTFIQEIQKEKYDPEFWDTSAIKVFTKLDDLIYPYETSKPGNWSVPILNRIMEEGFMTFTKDNNIDVNDVQIHSLMNLAYGRPLLKHFKHVKTYFNGLQLGEKMKAMREELDKYEAI